jgi:carboxylesterase type B
MSGTPLMLKALSLSAAESSYTQIMRALDIENATMEERLHRLLTMSPEELVERTPKHVTLTPFLDGDIIPSLPSFSHGKTMPTKNWCEDILLGSTAHDGAIFHFMGLAERAAGIARALQRSFSANMSPASIDAVLNVYGITPSTPDEEAMAKIIDLATDIAYYLPAVSYFRASSAKAKAHLYAFNEPNPWEGTFKGKSTHILDAAFLFLNFEDQMKGQEVKATGRKLAADFIGFANGIWKQEGETRVYGPKGEGRSDLGKLSMEGKVDLDELSRAWDLFVLGN